MEIAFTTIDELVPHPKNARVHSGKQIGQIAESIKRFGFLVPILIDDTGTILAGHGRHAAAKLLGMKEVPTVKAEGLTDTQKRAFLIADNKIALSAGWDREVLAVELPALAEILIQDDLDISITGFSAAEIDQIIVDFEEDKSDPADEVHPASGDTSPVTKPGDLWQLGKHRLLCGDARNDGDMARLMASEQAAMTFLDVPYNVRVRDIVGRGKIKHAEFAMASGEMSPEEFIEFLTRSFESAAAVSRDGSLHYICIDWRHVEELLKAGKTVFDDVINIAVWVKSSPAQGSFYRSQHEMICIFRKGMQSHLNNIELGRHGRSRSNVWNYPGIAGRRDELVAHPTPKPVNMVADAMKDCTARGDVVLDSFCGSGTTVVAAERVGRRAFAMEIEPRFVDVAIRRWQLLTGKDAIHDATGLTFDEVSTTALERAA